MCLHSWCSCKARCHCCMDQNVVERKRDINTSIERVKAFWACSTATESIDYNPVLLLLFHLHFHLHFFHFWTDDIHIHIESRGFALMTFIRTLNGLNVIFIFRSVSDRCLPNNDGLLWSYLYVVQLKNIRRSRHIHSSWIDDCSILLLKLFIRLGLRESNVRWNIIIEREFNESRKRSVFCHVSNPMRK